MRKLIAITLVLLFVGVQTAGAITAWNIRWGQDVTTNMASNTLRQWTRDIEGRIGAAGSAVGTGNIFYVDSNVTVEGNGTSWTNARNTLDEAVGLCTADNGDIIYVAQGHEESWTLADSADLDQAGITVIGCGEGEHRPLFTADGTAGELVIGDASIMITNLRFMASVDSTVHLIEVEADADGFIIYNCEFLEPESANTTDEADDIIQVAAGANQGFIVNNIFYSISAGANTAVDLTAGVVEDITVAYNYFNGSWAEGAIFSDDIDLRAQIIGNTVIQLHATMTPITFNTTATGIMQDNWCASKSTTYLIDPGSMQCKGNMWSDTDTTDVAAVPMFTSETGVDIWAASQTAQIEAEATDAIEADLLQYLYSAADGGTNPYPDSVVAQSALAFIMATGANPAVTSFDNTTDSLQAIADHVQTLITTGAGTGVYPTGVTNESIIAFMLAEGATATASTYDNTTDSLEAIRNRIDTINTADQVDIDAILLDTGTTIPAQITALEGVNFMMTATSAGAATTFISTDGGDGFGNDYFNTGWSIIITYDADGAGAAPEGDVRDIVDYDSATGTFTVAPVWSSAQSTAIGDKAIAVRHEDLDEYAVTRDGGSGRIIYVSSGQPGTPDVSDIGDLWDLSYTTLALAEAAAAAGDVIYVDDSHNEAIGDLVIDVANTTWIGMGHGDGRPRLDYDNATDEVTINAAGVTFKNFRLMPGASDVAAGIVLGANGDGCLIENVSFITGEGADEEFIDCIVYNTATVDSTVKNCTYYNTNATAADQDTFVNLDAATIDSASVIGCEVFGTFAEAPIWGGPAVPTNIYIADNTISNTTTGQLAIEFAGNATGVIKNNRLYSDSYATILDPGLAICINNWATDAADQQAIQIPISAETSDVTEVDDGSNLERLEMLQRQTEDTMARLGIDTTTADVWYVDSVSASGGTGTSWAQSEDTLKAAIDDATNSVGAYIFVAPGHAEATITASIAVDCPGITIVGLGTEALRPTFTFTGQNGDLAHTVADVTWINCLFVSSTADTDECMILDGSSDGATFIDCEWRSVGAFEFVSTVTIASGCDDVVFRRCKFNNATSGVGNATAAITNIAGVTDGMVIEDCEFYGAWTSAAIFSDDADTDVMIRNNIVQNTSTGVHAIEFSAAALGSLIDNMLYTDSVATVLDPGSLKCYGNKQASAIDAAAIDVPLVAGKTYAMSAGVDEVDATIFDVQGGEIMVHSFVGLVTVVIGGNATTCTIECDADDGAAWDVVFSTSVGVETDVAGTRYVFTDANPSVLTPLLKGGTEGSSTLMSSWFCPEGLLQQNMSADPGGAAGDHITWYMIFTPVSDGVIVVPQ